MCFLLLIYIYTYINFYILYKVYLKPIDITGINFANNFANNFVLCKKINHFCKVDPIFRGDFMLEKQIERRFCNRIRDSGGLSWKFTSPGNAGVPDRIVLFPQSKICFVELKRPGGKVRPLQAKVHKTLRKFGFPVYVISTYAEIDAFINDFLG